MDQLKKNAGNLNRPSGAPAEVVSKEVGMNSVGFELSVSLEMPGHRVVRASRYNFYRRSPGMFLRLVVIGLIFCFSACRMNDVHCPKPRTVKLNKKPANYMRAYTRAMSASSAREERAQNPRPKPRPVKSASELEAWDCPRPGGKTALPKSVKANIRKNRKRFEEHYRNRPDTLATVVAPRR